MGRVIRNQRKGRGSIFSQSIPSEKIFDMLEIDKGGLANEDKRC